MKKKLLRIFSSVLCLCMLTLHVAAAQKMPETAMMGERRKIL